jgi:hypothetical protein
MLKEAWTSDDYLRADFSVLKLNEYLRILNINTNIHPNELIRRFYVEHTDQTL